MRIPTTISHLLIALGVDIGSFRQWGAFVYEKVHDIHTYRRKFGISEKVFHLQPKEIYLLCELEMSSMTMWRKDVENEAGNDLLPS